LIFGGDHGENVSYVKNDHHLTVTNGVRFHAKRLYLRASMVQATTSQPSKILCCWFSRGGVPVTKWIKKYGLSWAMYGMLRGIAKMGSLDSPVERRPFRHKCFGKGGWYLPQD
jgi:hypothetical protein